MNPIKLLGLLAFLFGTSYQAWANDTLFLRIDEDGYGKTHRIHVGETLTFRLKGEKEDLELPITGLDFEKQEIVCNDYRIPCSSISLVRVERGKFAIKSAGFMLMTFGTVWTGFAVAGQLFGDKKLEPMHLIVGGTSIAVGYALTRMKFLWMKTFHNKDNIRVRIILLSRSKGEGGRV